MVVHMGLDRFGELADAAYDRLPEPMLKAMDNVAVFIDDDSPADQPPLLGLYEGVPTTERDSWYAGQLPDRIWLFRNNICRMCTTEAEVAEQIRITLVHEIGHHLGLDDDRLQELGYG